MPTITRSCIALSSSRIAALAAGLILLAAAQAVSEAQARDEMICSGKGLNRKCETVDSNSTAACRSHCDNWPGSSEGNQDTIRCKIACDNRDAPARDASNPGSPTNPGKPKTTPENAGSDVLSPRAPPKGGSTIMKSKHDTTKNSISNVR